ncbi:MAG: hypothetical protein JSW60_01750 [Thermoplasmatales archaeon]|nr:MAG: hypothetical protein JSW60_01750 [Thermoplasmatales archaeon]
MIRLKKNDKLIIIIAVVIIIIAGIGIAAYKPPEEEIETPETGVNMYTVGWEKKTSSFAISEFASKNTPFSESYVITAPTGSILTNVDFEIAWHDDKTIGIFLKRGLDTLTADIVMDGETKTHESRGEGNETLSFSINDIPYDDTIEADDRSDAEQKIYNMSNGQHTKTYEITVTVKTGEPLRRPLKYLRDNGNDFEIKVTYDYYHVSLIEEETKETGSEASDETKEEEYTPPYLSMIIGTGCGRYI